MSGISARVLFYLSNNFNQIVASMVLSVIMVLGELPNMSVSSKFMGLFL
jgi:hypothetical protein